VKILYVSNNKEYDYKRAPRGDFALLHFFKKKGHEVLALPKKDMLKFYLYYKKFKPDIVTSSFVPGGFITAILNKMGLINCPLIHCWDDYYADSMMNYPRFLISFMEEFTVKNSDYITTVSRYNELKAIDLGKIVYYIPNGVISNRKKTKLNLNSLKTDAKNLKLVYLGGNYHKSRKIEEIILAVKNLKCDLFVFGEAHLNLVSIAGKNVHFVGQVDPSEVFYVLKQADILVNNMNADCNFKLLDYISAGKPIITSDGMVRNVLTNRKNAILTKSFRKDLEILINDKKLRETLEKNIKKIKVKTWEQLADTHLKLYSELLKITK